jgi:hypothetical protein
MDMATENIVLLACAAALVTLHLVGGPLSGIWAPEKRRPGRSKRVIPQAQNSPAAPDDAKAESNVRSVA